MKKLLTAFIIMLSVSCVKQDINVTDKTPLPNAVVKALSDTTIKYNQTIIESGNYLYVIENKVVIKAVSLYDNEVFSFILVILLIISFCVIIGLANID